MIGGDGRAGAREEYRDIRDWVIPERYHKENKSRKFRLDLLSSSIAPLASPLFLDTLLMYDV